MSCRLKEWVPKKNFLLPPTASATGCPHCRSHWTLNVCDTSPQAGWTGCRAGYRKEVEEEEGPISSSNSPQSAAWRIRGRGESLETTLGKQIKDGSRCTLGLLLNTFLLFSLIFHNSERYSYLLAGLNNSEKYISTIIYRFNHPSSYAMYLFIFTAVVDFQAFNNRTDISTVSSWRPRPSAVSSSLFAASPRL